MQKMLSLKSIIFSICFFACCFSLISQNIEKSDQVPKLTMSSFGLVISEGNSFFHNAPFVFDNCEDCIRENQRNKPIFDLSIESEFKYSKDQSMLLGLGISEYGFKEDHYFRDRLFKQSPSFVFFSIKAGHVFNIWSNKKLSAKLSNTLSIDIMPGGLWLIKRWNSSYILRPTIEYKFSEKIVLSVNPFFRQSILHYNRVRFDKDYLPYSYGLGIGIHYQIEHQKDKINGDNSNRFSEDRLISNSSKRNRSSTPKVNSLYFELGGPAAYYSINYERRFPFSKNVINSGLALSVGMLYLPKSISDPRSYAIPLQLTFAYQHFKKRFDIGVASTFYSNEGNYETAQVIILRYSKLFRNNENFEWGLTFSPFIRFEGEFQYQAWGGIRWGYKLDKRKRE